MFGRVKLVCVDTSKRIERISVWMWCRTCSSYAAVFNICRTWWKRCLTSELFTNESKTKSIKTKNLIEQCYCHWWNQSDIFIHLTCVLLCVYYHVGRWIIDVCPPLTGDKFVPAPNTAANVKYIGCPGKWRKYDASTVNHVHLIMIFHQMTTFMP